jgi:hypothetical protein
VHVDHAGTKPRELTFGKIRVRVVEVIGDDQAEHRIAKEFKTLVGLKPTVLISIRTVGQRKRQKLVIKGDVERFQ